MKESTGLKRVLGEREYWVKESTWCKRVLVKESTG